MELSKLRWPSPSPLEGIKSKKRAIFEVPMAYFKSNGDQSVDTFSGLKLTLESRTVATGPVVAGAITELLLGSRQFVTGTASQHDYLNVAHIGPQLIDKSEQSVDQYMDAVSVALEKKPHVVILDAAVESGNQAWSEVFNSMLDSQAMQEFRGAIVICTSVETPMIRRICSHRWTGIGKWVWEEEIDADQGLEFLEDVLNMPDVLNEPLLKEVSNLAWKEPFVEDIIEKAKEKGWSMTLLITSSSLAPHKECLQTPDMPSKKDQTGSQNDSRDLAGFICYKIRPETSFDILRVAVVEKSRSAGYGRKLMRWALEKASGMPRSEIPWIALSALDEVIPFYERFGFWDMTCNNFDDDEQFQTLMEMENISCISEEAASLAPPLV
jgi:hypothetical protein